MTMFEHDNLIDQLDDDMRAAIRFGRVWLAILVLGLLALAVTFGIIGPVSVLGE